MDWPELAGDVFSVMILPSLVVVFISIAVFRTRLERFGAAHTNVTAVLIAVFAWSLFEILILAYNIWGTRDWLHAIYVARSLRVISAITLAAAPWLPVHWRGRFMRWATAMVMGAFLAALATLPGMPFAVHPHEIDVGLGGTCSPTDRDSWGR